MKYNITDILNFVETSPCSTIMQAATKLEISQPALSESIKRLENNIGYKLFYRSRTGIKLTPSGKNFLEKAKVVVRSLEDLHSKSNSENLFLNHSITIGAHPMVAQYTLPEAFNLLRKKAPDFKFELTHGLSRDMQYDIQKGNIDIGIIINPTSVPDLIITKLANDRVCIWNHPKNKITDTVYCNLNIFQTQSLLKKWNNKPKKVISTQSLELIAQFANKGLGYAILPERVVKLLTPRLKLKEDAPQFTDEICLVYRPEFGKISAEKLTIDAIKKVFE